MTTSYRAHFPNSAQSASLARQALLVFARQYGFSETVLADIECALGEALANAAEHGHRADSGFNVRSFCDGDALVFEIHDEGSGFIHGGAESSSQPPPTGSPRGFGIYIMRTLMDEIEFSDRGTRVQLRKRLPVAASDQDDIAQRA